MDIILNMDIIFYIWCIYSYNSKSLESLNMTNENKLYSCLKNKDIILENEVLSNKRNITTQ